MSKLIVLCNRFCNKLIARIRKEADPEVAAQITCFEKLPTEIWQGIASYLPRSSTASLALTCRSAYNTMGIQSLVDMKSPDHKTDKCRFLELMDNRFPGHFLCYSHGIYHPRGLRKAHRRRTAFMDITRPWACDPPSKLFLLSADNNITWATVQLIMRAHRYQPAHGKSVKTLRGNFNGGRGWHTYSKPCIIDDRLLVRVSAYYWIPTGSVLQEDGAGAFPELGVGVTCQHCHANPKLKALCMNALVRFRDARPKPWMKGSFEYWSRLYRCLLCPTEYQVALARPWDFSELDKTLRETYKCHYVLVVRRWIDFGEGRSAESREWVALAGKMAAGRQPTLWDTRGAPTIQERFGDGDDEDAGF